MKKLEPRQRKYTKAKQARVQSEEEKRKREKETRARVCQSVGLECFATFIRGSSNLVMRREARQ